MRTLARLCGDLSLRWLHCSYCRFYREMAQIYIPKGDNSQLKVSDYFMANSKDPDQLDISGFSRTRVNFLHCLEANYMFCI